MILNIRKLRLERKMTLEQLAAKAGISRSLLNEFELGTKRPNTKRLQQIADALGVGMVDLFDTSAGVVAAGQAANGFHEPQVEPWRGSNANRAAPAAILSAFGGGLGDPALFTSRAGVAALGVLAGDILVVDLAMRATQGDTVLVTVADLDTGAAETLLRRYVPPFVLSGDPDDPRANLRLDQTGAVAVMGVVTAIIRDELTRRRGQAAGA